MTVLILSGPPASGKNTVAEQLARRLTRTAIVDTDVLRRMLTHDDGQVDTGRLSARNACAIAVNCAEAGCDVIIVDTLSDDQADFYRKQLAKHDVRITQLMPTEDEVHRRLLSHTDYLSRGDIGLLYKRQGEFTAYDWKIDNSVIEPDAVADDILERAGITVTTA